MIKGGTDHILQVLCYLSLHSSSCLEVDRPLYLYDYSVSIQGAFRVVATCGSSKGDRSLAVMMAVARSLSATNGEVLLFGAVAGACSGCRCGIGACGSAVTTDDCSEDDTCSGMTPGAVACADVTVAPIAAGSNRCWP
mmetsp:Transcript_21488/g.59797  ORF Transcript_21488/g.59797 Transcript_21488/m.59797 type:complete len:138 (-) Transcript_21488:11-424(-)